MRNTAISRKSFKDATYNKTTITYKDISVEHNGDNNILLLVRGNATGRSDSVNRNNI